MNEFGRTFLATYTRMRPKDLELMLDPQEFFTALGEEAEGRIEMRMDQITDSQEAEEDYLAEVRRVQQARETAREEVMRQMLDELIPEHLSQPGL